MKRLFLCLLTVLIVLPLLSGFSTQEEAPPGPAPAPASDEQIDYLSVMLRAAMAGDTEAGRAAELARSEQLGAADTPVAFDDLFLLAKLIQSEAGSTRIGLEWRMCVGEVVLNRVASPEFPDSIEEVVFQPGQYAEAGTEEFRCTLTPDETSVRAALRLLQGERLMAPQVVFQANFQQGAGVYTLFYDRLYGYTYFCTSPHPELYG